MSSSSYNWTLDAAEPTRGGGGGQAGIREGDGHSSDHVGLEATWGA